MKASLKDHRLLSQLVIVLVTALVYSFSLNGEFHFDDIRRIVNNPTIKDLSNFWPPFQGRYLVDLTFAINYQFHGLQTLGYHLVNVLIHIVNSLLVYALIRITFERFMDEEQRQTGFIAFAGSMLFALHPIQTQAVSYIVQRYASQSTMFYLLAIYLYIKWRKTNRWPYYGGVIFSLLASMHSKEIGFTAPFAILLYEMVFLKERTGKVRLAISGIMLTALVIPLERFSDLLYGLFSGGGSTASIVPVVSEEGVSIPYIHYVYTQFRVLLTYLRLFFLPVNQMVDYDYPVYHSIFESQVLISLAVLLALIGMAVYLFRRRSTLRITGFGIIFFFIAVSVESFLVSLPHVIFEHRMYLPSVGVVFAICGLLGYLLQMRKPFERFLYAGFLIVALVFSVLSINRNLIWRTEIALWKDNVEKAPMRTAPHYHLAVALRKAGRFKEALEHLWWASRLSPDYPEIYYQICLIYEKLHMPDKAIEACMSSLRVDQRYLPSQIMLGNMYYRLGRFQQALYWYKKALSLDPKNPTLLYNLSLTRKMLEAVRDH